MRTIYIPSSEEKKVITRRVDGSGVIRINAEACNILEGIINKLNIDISVTRLASLLIKDAAENNIIKEEEK